MSFELSGQCFKFVPFYRQSALLDGYRKAEKRIKELVKEYSEKITVKPTGMTVNQKGQLVSEISHYSEEDDVIYMEDNVDNDLYADTYKHEFRATFHGRKFYLCHAGG